MQQVLRRGLKHIVVAEVTDPPLRPHHVLVRPAASLISSGTETASIHRDSLAKEVAENPDHVRKVLAVMAANGPFRTIDEVRAKFGEYAVLGYSGAGTVAAVHPTVRDLAPGDRVAYGGEGTGHGESVVTGRHLVARLPEGVPFEAAAFTTLGSIALNAVRAAEIGVGDRVLVIGLGLVGQLTAQLCRVAGARVLVSDLLGERVDLACALSGGTGIAAGDATREQVLAATDGRGADCVIVAAAAKSDVPMQVALGACRDRGRIVVVGAVDVRVPWLEAYLKEVRVIMARAYGPGSYDPAYEQQGIDYPLPYVRWTENRNMEEFLALVDRKAVQLEPLVTHRMPLAEAPRAYDTIMDPGSRSLAVILRYPAADQPAALPHVPTTRVDLPGPAHRPGRFGVALVGSGNIARWAHMPALRAVPDAQLRAVHSASGARGRSFAERYGAAYFTNSLDEVLGDPDTSVVVVTSRNQHHASQVVAALRAGKHVFVEKPLALTAAECRTIAEVASTSSGRVCVGFNRRFAPDYLALKGALRGRRGPFVLNCRVNSPGISGGYWMADPSAGGAILGEACHFTDLLPWLLDAEPVEVFAHAFPSTLSDPIPDNNVAATFRFADGSIANLTYCTVGSRTSGGERVEAFGPGIGAMTEDFQRFARLAGLRQRRSRWFAAKGYGDQLAAFFEALRRGTAPVPGLEEGVRSTMACLALLESARTGAPQPIEWRSLLA